MPRARVPNNPPSFSPEEFRRLEATSFERLISDISSEGALSPSSGQLISNDAHVRPIEEMADSSA